MENSAKNIYQNNDWQIEENDIIPTDASIINEFGDSDENEIVEEENENKRYSFYANNTPDPDDEDEDDDDSDEDDDEDEDEGDWGHTDPAEGNSPFPDSNEPSFPGSAI